MDWPVGVFFVMLSTFFRSMKILRILYSVFLGTRIIVPGAR